MKKLITMMFVCGVMLMSISSVSAWSAKGHVYCDVNENSEIDPGDFPLHAVVVNVVNVGGTFSGSRATDSTGYFKISILGDPDSYIETLDPATLPADAVIVVPPGGQHTFTTSDDESSSENDWLIQSELCQQGACWLTGGGVKFESVVGADLATHGPRDTLGGNVNPGCSPTAGEGGQWNHVAHTLKLHFQGTAIQVVRCGNVDGIEPGSESPVTPFNFIEYTGTGRLKGIKGNKVDFPLVYFFARSEDHNEPGSNGAKDGEDVDKYFLHVYSNPADPAGSTLLLVDVDGNPATVDPITISGGNLQIHISSCDNPPLGFTSTSSGSNAKTSSTLSTSQEVKTPIRR